MLGSRNRRSLGVGDGPGHRRADPRGDLRALPIPGYQRAPHPTPRLPGMAHPPRRSSKSIPTTAPSSTSPSPIYVQRADDDSWVGKVRLHSGVPEDRDVEITRAAGHTYLAEAGDIITLPDLEPVFPEDPRTMVSRMTEWDGRPVAVLVQERSDSQGRLVVHQIGTHVLCHRSAPTAGRSQSESFRSCPSACGGRSGRFSCWPGRLVEPVRAESVPGAPVARPRST